MKRITKVLLVLITIVLITGCTLKDNIKMTISSNKDIKVKMIMAMDDEMIDSMMSMNDLGETDEKKEYTDKERWEYLESDDNDTFDISDDYDVEKYDQDGFKGYVATKSLGKIDALTTTQATERVNILEDDDMFKGNIFIKNGTEYKSNMKVDMADDEQNIDSYESYGAIFDMKLVIEFPTVPLSHNAQEVSTDGKTLTWDLLKTKDIDFTFDFNKNGKVTKKTTDKKDTETIEPKEQKRLSLLIYGGLIIGGIIIVGIIVTVVLVIVFTSKKKKNQPVQQNINQGITQNNDK